MFENCKTKCTITFSVSYVYGIDVLYQTHDGAPDGYLSQNINKGFSGKWVYIKPKRTSDILRAASGFELVLDRNPHPHEKDLSGGSLSMYYRYLFPTYTKWSTWSPRINVTSIYFLESNPNRESCTEDINKDRNKGQFLYLCWRGIRTGRMKLYII